MARPKINKNILKNKLVKVLMNQNDYEIMLIKKKILENKYNIMRSEVLRRAMLKMDDEQLLTYLDFDIF